MVRDAASSEDDVVEVSSEDDVIEVSSEDDVVEVSSENDVVEVSSEDNVVEVEESEVEVPPAQKRRSVAQKETATPISGKLPKNDYCIMH